MKRLIYLSHFLSEETQGFGGSSVLARKKLRSICCGDSSNSEEFQLSGHGGTHVDFPVHFDQNGRSSHDYGPEFWCFKQVHLMQCPAEMNSLIQVGDWCDGIPPQTDLLLIKTNFQRFRGRQEYWQSNPGISKDLARWLRQNRSSLKAIGFDFISLTSFDHRQEGREAHRELLAAGTDRSILIFEDMNLSDLSISPEEVNVFPLLIHAADGVPITVVARLS